MAIMQREQSIILRICDGGGVRERAAQVARARARPARHRHAPDGAAALVRQHHAHHRHGALLARSVH